jgi:type I restriction enzyme, S subunit
LRRGVFACKREERRPKQSRYLSMEQGQLFLTAFYKPLREYGRGGSQEALNCEIVANWAAARPSESEQQAICDAMRRESDRLREAGQSISRQVQSLREYRTRPIAGAVTGKLDVREAAARLPDETDENEPPGGTKPLADAEDNTDPDAAPEEAEA